MSDNAQQLLLDELAAFAEPVGDAALSPLRRAILFRSLGWDPGAAVGMSTEELEDWLATVARAVEGVERLVEDPPDTLGEVQDALGVAADAAQAVTGLPPGLAEGGPQLPPAELLVGDLLGYLTVDWLERRHAALLRLLVLLTLIRPSEAAEPSEPLPAAGAPVRLSLARPELRFDRVGALLSDPLGALRGEYFPDGLDTADEANAAADLLFPRVVALLRELGAEALYGLDPELAPPLDDAAVELASHMLSFSVPLRVGAARVRLGAGIGLSSADRGGLGLVVMPSGRLAFTQAVAGWTLGLDAAGAAGGFAVGPAGLVLVEGASPSLALQARADKLPGEEGQALLLGSATGTRLEVGDFGLTFAASFGTALDDVEVAGRVGRAALVVAAGDGDGFLASVLPKEGLRAEFELGLGWSRRKGVHFSGSAGLDAALPVHVALGPIEVREVQLRLAAAAEGLSLALSATAALKLGPLTANVERMGIEARSSFSDGIRFKPPAGAGLAIAAGPVRGGGYVFFDPENEQYAGVLALEFQAISLKAVGLLTTRLPDGAPGFSLLVIISAEFTPIQLGFGFTLSGVGGLLGINRTVALEPLRAGVRDRSLDAIMFPKDPVGNAAALVATLGTLFPPARGRHVFGPMARLNWGTPALITLDLGLALELPAPVRLIVLGRLRVALPRPEAPLVSINMDVVGVIDFDRGDASVDATLYDSTIAGFALTGDMAMRATWRERPAFALAAGGFNPRFQPPAGFPALRRLTLSLATGDNPRIRLETYLALTSNTAQFGARLELYAEGGGFSVEGLLYFDALFRFDPFEFVADMGGALALKRGSRAILTVTVDVTLSGPNPWHARGKATYSILGFKGSVSFDARFGRALPEPPPEPVDVGLLLDAAIGDPRNWSAQVPPAGASAVSLRELQPGPRELLAHPLGTLGFVQRVAPLGVELRRFGTAPLEDGPQTFRIAAVRAGTEAAETVTVEDYFAPAQFRELSDSEKLESPSFERFEAGRRLATAGVAYDATSATPAVLEYETAILDAPDEPARPAGRDVMDGATLVDRAGAGAAAQSTLREEVLV